MIKELWQSYITGLKNIFKLKWRMSKYDFCSFLIVHFFVCLLVFAVLYFFESTVFFFLLLVLLTIVPYLAIGHRLQDMGKSGFRLLLYMFTFVAFFLMCFGLVERWVVEPLDRSGVLTNYHCLSYGVKYGYYLSFLIFLFLVYKWVFGEGDKNANKFGKMIKQNKMSKWFMVLPLFFAAYVISFPWVSMGKAIVYYTAAICGMPDDVLSLDEIDVSNHFDDALILDDAEASNSSNNIVSSNDSSMNNCEEFVSVSIENHNYVIMCDTVISDDARTLDKNEMQEIIEKYKKMHTESQKN